MTAEALMAVVGRRPHSDAVRPLSPPRSNYLDPADLDEGGRCGHLASRRPVPARTGGPVEAALLYAEPREGWPPPRPAGRRAVPRGKRSAVLPSARSGRRGPYNHGAGPSGPVGPLYSGGVYVHFQYREPDSKSGA